MQRAIKAAQSVGTIQSPEGWQTAVRKMGRLVEWHKRLQDEPGPLVEERRPRHSKRQDLRGLPDDWRERLVARMPNYRLAALTNAVTGCRPDELVKGVQLAINGRMLVATIQGAKVTGENWQHGAAILAADSATPLVRMLVAEVRAGVSLAQIVDAKAYSGPCVPPALASVATAEDDRLRRTACGTLLRPT
jgi:hypothetical protein